MQQLSLMDTTFLMHESPRTPNHLCMVNVYDPSSSPRGAPTFDEMLAKVEACVPAAPSLRRKLVHVPFFLDRPYWIDDPEFDLEFHVRQVALPRPGDWHQLCVQSPVCTPGLSTWHGPHGRSPLSRDSLASWPFPKGPS